MPNGGSDCCGTCPFNRANNGKIGYQEDMREVFSTSYCLIRNLKIDATSPMYTYCANHPRHNPSLIEVPIGPVFINETRDVWKPSLDTPEIRKMLMRLISNLQNVPTQNYPHGIDLQGMAINHIRDILFKEAVPELARILRFDEEATRINDPFQINRRGTVFRSLLALCEILKGEAVPYVDEYLGKHKKRQMKFWKSKHEQWVLKAAISAFEIIDNETARSRIVQLEKSLDLGEGPDSKYS